MSTGDITVVNGNGGELTERLDTLELVHKMRLNEEMLRGRLNELTRAFAQLQQQVLVLASLLCEQHPAYADGSREFTVTLAEVAALQARGVAIDVMPGNDAVAGAIIYRMTEGKPPPEQPPAVVAP